LSTRVARLSAVSGLFIDGDGKDVTGGKADIDEEVQS
jgi:hypothetical protein